MDKLFEILVQWMDRIVPLIMVNDYQRGVLFRFGPFKRILEPGAHFRIPFFDEYDMYDVATTTIDLPPQSVVTKDGQEIVIKSVVKYSVTDVRIFGVDVSDATAAISDMTRGVIFDVIKARTWEESCGSDLNSLITTPAKREAKRWGVTIDKVTVTDFSRMPSFRILTEAHQTSLLT